MNWALQCLHSWLAGKTCETISTFNGKFLSLKRILPQGSYSAVKNWHYSKYCKTSTVVSWAISARCNLRFVLWQLTPHYMTNHYSVYITLPTPGPAQLTLYCLRAELHEQLIVKSCTLPRLANCSPAWDNNSLSDFFHSSGPNFAFFWNVVGILSF